VLPQLARSSVRENITFGSSPPPPRASSRVRGALPIGLTLLAAVAYGIVHDQVTARVCVEYFTIGHPPLIPSTSPTLLGLAWGVVATWWVGLPLGFMLAAAARLGPRPKLGAAQFMPLVARLLAIMGAAALVAGIVGFVLAVQGKVALPPMLAEAIPAAARSRFLADWWAHSASYASGILGGIIVAVSAYLRRRSLHARTA